MFGKKKARPVKVKPVIKRKVMKKTKPRTNTTGKRLRAVLKVIKREFRPIRGALGEKEVERQLIQFLRGRFGRKSQFDYQKYSREGVTDILIDGGKGGALELKIDEPGSLQRALSQAQMYKKFANSVGVVIIDTGKMNPAKIEENVRQLNKTAGIEAIVIRP